jgi:hypothetical protein
VFVSGVCQSSYGSNMAYVPSKSLYVPGLTYMETIRYAAKLLMRGHEEQNERTPPDEEEGTDKEEGAEGATATAKKESFDALIERRITDVMSLMNLAQCKHRKVSDMASVE